MTLPQNWHGDEEVVKFLAELMEFSGAAGPELYQLFVLKGDFEAQCFSLIILGFSVTVTAVGWSQASPLT